MNLRAKPATIFKIRLRHKFFVMNLAKDFRKAFWQKNSGRLLLLLSETDIYIFLCLRSNNVIWINWKVWFRLLCCIYRVIWSDLWTLSHIALLCKASLVKYDITVRLKSSLWMVFCKKASLKKYLEY